MSIFYSWILVPIITCIVACILEFFGDTIVERFINLTRAKIAKTHGTTGAEFWEDFLRERWEVERNRASSRAYAIVRFIFYNCGLLRQSTTIGLNDVLSDKEIPDRLPVSNQPIIAGSSKPRNPKLIIDLADDKFRRTLKDRLWDEIQQRNLELGKGEFDLLVEQFKHVVEIGEKMDKEGIPLPKKIAFDIKSFEILWRYLESKK